MRVSTGSALQSDGRMFSVTIAAMGVGQQRRGERTLRVPFQRLQALMQTVAQQGGRITAVTPVSDVASDAAPAAESPAPQAAPSAEPKASPSKPASVSASHADVPVNLYKPKNPFVGTVTENYSLLADGAIGRVNHIT
ncbi:MAG: phycobilisome linker polypeptide, partial [Cyanobacteriota bacterium]|nr:phycobilisome linker polypeptide [Cyanobacteriota bacterium]